MATNTKACRASFGAELNKIHNNITKSLGEKTAIAQFKGDKRAIKEYVEGFSKQLKEDIKKLTTENYRDKFDAEYVSALKGRVKRQVIDVLNTYKIANDNVELIDSIMKRTTTASGAKAAIKTWTQSQHTKIKAGDRWYEEVVETSFETLEKAGVRVNPKAAKKARKYFYNAMSGGNSLRNYLTRKGIKDADRAIYLALRDGGFEGDAVLDNIARAHKHIDAQVIKKAQADAPYLGKIENHVLPFRLDRNKLAIEGVDKFIEDMVASVSRKDMAKYIGKTDYTDKDVVKALTSWFDAAVEDGSFAASSKYASTKRIFGHRAIHFDDFENEFGIMMKYGDTRNGIIPGAFQHKRALLRKITMYNNIGPDVGFTLHTLNKHLGTKKIKGLDQDDITRTLVSESEHLETMAGLKSHLGETANHVLRSIDNIMSAALTQVSNVRNLVFDNTLYSALGSAVYKDGSVVVEAAKTMWGMASYAVRKGQTKEYIHLIESQGLAARMSFQQYAQGIIENAAGDGWNAGSKAARMAHRVSLKAANFTSVAGGGDLTVRVSRMYQAMNTTGILKKAQAVSYDKLNNALKGTLEQTGIGKAEWELFQQLSTIQRRGKDIVFDFDSLSKLPDEAFAKMLRPLESTKGAKLRLKAIFQDMQSTMMDEMSATVSHRGRLIPSGSTNPLVMGVLKSAFKFSNIALSQYMNMNRAMMKASGLDPNGVNPYTLFNLALAKRDPALYGKYMATIASGGALILWAGDQSKGLTPRTMSPDDWVEALTVAGFGGVTNIALNSFVFSGDVVSTPISAFGKPIISLLTAETEEGRKRAAMRLAKLVPGMNLWYTRAAINKAMAKGMGIAEYSRWDRRMMEERNQDPVY